MNVKCVVVGDGAVGKTCLLQSFCEGTFPEEYVPTVFDNSTKDMVVDEHTISLGLWDTAGQEEFDRLRPLSYPNAQVFLLCYSVDSVVSANNVKAKWQPELNYHCPRVPIILVGTKVDVRAQKEKSPKKMMSRSDGEKLARAVKATKFLECSARTQENLDRVFEEAVRAVVSRKTTKKSCSIL